MGIGVGNALAGVAIEHELGIGEEPYACVYNSILELEQAVANNLNDEVRPNACRNTVVYSVMSCSADKAFLK